MGIKLEIFLFYYDSLRTLSDTEEHFRSRAAKIALVLLFHRMKHYNQIVAKTAEAVAYGLGNKSFLRLQLRTKRQGRPLGDLPWEI